jgi:hypothetical protein
MLLRLCGPPSIPLSFTVAGVLPRWITYRFRLATESYLPTASNHRLLYGLPGYLILFDPHTFEPQCQLQFCELPSQSVFYDISKYFTTTCHIPPTSFVLKTSSINGSSIVKRWDFTTDLQVHLRSL